MFQGFVRYNKEGRFYGRVGPDGVVMTTGQVAKLCGVACRTVSKWCDSGKLRHHRIPNSDDRRIMAHHLIEFLRASKGPIPEGLEVLDGMRQQTLLTLGLPSGGRAAFEDGVLLTGRLVKVVHSAGVFDCAMVLARSRVTTLVCGPEVAAGERAAVVQGVDKFLKPDTRPKMIGVMAEDGKAADWDAFPSLAKEPVDWKDVGAAAAGGADKAPAPETPQDYPMLNRVEV